jgi:hypothetical protein
MAMLPRRWATIRGMAVAAAATAILGLATHLLLVPPYREITGFAPFDLQFPLSQVMIGIELGAFAKNAAAWAYTHFAIAHFAFGLATAVLFALAWAWLFEKCPTRMFGFFMRGGILMLPFYVVLLDAVEKAGFSRLLSGAAAQSYSATIEFCVTVHRLKFALADIRNYVTLAIVVIVGITLLRRRFSRTQP